MKIGYHPDCECLYKSNNDLYVVSVPKSCFKNFNQRIIPDVFTHTLSPTTSKYLDEYLEKYRKLSPFSKESEYFFLTYYKPHATTKSLSRTLKYFFSNYGDQTLRKGGINIHFIRDIVATTYLKIHPASFLQVGMLLLDSEVTVKMNYGHLKPKDVLRNWQDHIETMKNKGD